MTELKSSAIMHVMIRVIEETHPQVLECDDLISKEMMANVIVRRIVRHMIRLSHVVAEVRNPNFTYNIDDEANQYYATDGCTDEGRGKLRDFMTEYEFILKIKSIELNEKFHEWYRALVECVNPDGTVKKEFTDLVSTLKQVSDALKDKETKDESAIQEPVIIQGPDKLVSDQPENEPAKETSFKAYPRVKILIGNSNTVLENKINEFLNNKNNNYPGFKIIDIKYNVVRVGYYSALIIYEI